MKRFTFRLEALLKYRTFLEQQAMQEMVAVQQLLEESIQKLNALTGERDLALVRFDTEAAQGISGERFRLHTDFIADAELRIKEEEERKKRIVYRLEEKREALRQAQIRKQVLENYKERQKTEYLAEIAQEIQKETDDLIAVRKAREILS